MADGSGVWYGSRPDARRHGHQSIELLACDDAPLLPVARIVPAYDIIDHIIDRSDPWRWWFTNPRLAQVAIMLRFHAANSGNSPVPVSPGIASND